MSRDSELLWFSSCLGVHGETRAAVLSAAVQHYGNGKLLHHSLDRDERTKHDTAGAVYARLFGTH